MNNFAKVIINLSHSNVESVYTYKIPDEFLDKIKIGMRVIVPFGFGNKNYEAYVVNLVDTIDFPIEKAKSIIDLPSLDDSDRPLFSLEMLKLAKFMKNKYYCNFIDCLNVMKPSGLIFETEFVVEVVENKKDFKLTPKAKEIVDYIISNKNKVAEEELIDFFGQGVKRTIKTLSEKKIVKRIQMSEVRDLTQKVKVAYLNRDFEKFDEELKKIQIKNDAKNKIISFLQESETGNGVRVKDLMTYFGISMSPITTLEKYGLVSVETEEVFRNIDYKVYEEKNKNKVLTEEQKQTVDFINNKIDENSKKTITIFGVTGSGKTEVYMEVIEKVLNEGKQAIVLVPEISLTGQTVSRFVNRFGDKVGVMHSRLSQGERFDQWKKARDSKISVMIGARSAIFTPFENLGIVIIDEEHEHTYKSETTPKYCAKEVARVRCDNTNSILILGSATPSIDTFYKSQKGEFDLVTLENRVNNSFPKVSVIDMRTELKDGNNSIFSKQLYESMENAFKKDEQVILFLNKRGASNFVSCRNCGYVCECDNCSVSLTYHSYNNTLMCHYCGKKIKNPKICPQCGSKHIKYFGVGTQRVEEEVKKIFNVEVVRMDFDTTNGKNGHEKNLEKFRSKEAKVLVGTQMITKGLDFPDVTVVGAIASDMSINSGDYRSAETTFQLLTQVAGRAGRHEKKGEVFVQTYNPEHYAIVESAKNDYNSFYRQEIILRENMHYPPFSNIFVVMLTGENEREIILLLHTFKELLIQNNTMEYEVYDPTPAIVSKIKKRFRWKIIVKGNDERILMNFVLNSVNQLKEKNNVSNVNINLNLNPTIIP